MQGAAPARRAAVGCAALWHGAAHSFELCGTPGKAGPGQGARSVQLSRDQIWLGSGDDLEAPVVSRSQLENCGTVFPSLQQGGLCWGGYLCRKPGLTPSR